MARIDGRTLTKLVALLGGTAITLYALHLGYDSKLAVLAILGLFGGEKLLQELLSGGED